MMALSKFNTEDKTQLVFVLGTKKKCLFTKTLGW